MKAHSDQSDNHGAIEIEECGTASQIEAVYPVMKQLRTELTLESFLDRVSQAQKNGYRLYCARIDGAIVGALGFRVQSDLAWGRNLYVDDLVVEETWRSRGIGSALMKFAAELAHADECQYVRLASGVSRTRVHGFYERLGYRKTSFAFALKQP